MLQGRVTKANFQFIVEKVQSRLASWMNKLLNKAGRLTLGKSLLNSLPVYYMQVAWLPQNICDHIDKLTRDFVWKGSRERGINLVGWDKITRKKVDGCLGIRVARDMNTAMLGKLLWDLHANTNKLWVNLLVDKYMGNEAILRVKKLNGSYIWNSIMKARDILRDGYEFRMGNGQSSLWYSSWTELGMLSKLVPYVDIHDTQLSKSDIYVNGAWNFNSLYTNLPHHILEFIQGLYFHPNAEVEDAFIWKGKLDGMYSAKAVYDWMLGQKYPRSSDLNTVSWKWIWTLPGLRKSNF